MSNDTIHILVLVAGTVDPISLSPNDAVRASSYSGKNNYWAENPNFIQGLKHLCDTTPNLALFDAHGWSGDNTKENREIAGAYLANRLCGSNGENAYYSGYRNKKVAFHLIGHSHGGNVLNEFTKRAAVAEEWPDTWQIKSVLYLSTPFFKHQHQLDCSALSPDCRIINVTNDFDITQRVIADFSMYDLASAVAIVSKETPAFHEAIHAIKQTPFMNGINKLIGIFAQPSALKLLFNSASYKFSDQDGAQIYSEMLTLLHRVKHILTGIKAIADKLSDSLYYPSDKVVKRQEPQSTRHFMNETLKQETDNLIGGLIAHISHIHSAIETRHHQQDYSVTPLIGDIAPDLNHLIDFFTLDVDNAKGPFVDLLFALINNQIENFDNTTATPIHQLNDAFKEQLFHVNVTNKDTYYEAGNLAGFQQFIEKLENAEHDYEQDPTQKHLLKILITLLAPQSELNSVKTGMRKGIDLLDNVFGTQKHSLKRFLAKAATLWGDMTPIRKLAIRFQTLLKSYDHLIQEFDIDLLTPLDNPKTSSVTRSATTEAQTSSEAETQQEKEQALRQGTLAHFAVVSHSVSRQKLYPEVEALLTPQFEKKKVRTTV